MIDRNLMRGAARREAGFTLLELLIVISVIAVLAAISIPQILQGRAAAYETSAHVYMRTVHQAEVAFQTRENRWGTLAELRSGGYISGEAPSSYTFVLEIAADGAAFTATGTPLVSPDSLQHFFVDTSGVVRYAVGAPADANSTPK